MITDFDIHLLLVTFSINIIKITKFDMISSFVIDLLFCDIFGISINIITITKLAMISNFAFHLILHVFVKQHTNIKMRYE